MATKAALIELYDGLAPQRDRWKRRNRYYYRELDRLICRAVQPGHRVLEVGCGTGDTLNAVKPSFGVGVDFSEGMLRVARGKYPHLHLVRGDAEHLPVRGTFDYVILSNLIGDLRDIWQAFRELKPLLHPGSRIVITYYNFVWEWALRVGARLGLRMPQVPQNWLSLDDILNLLRLNGFEAVQCRTDCLLPKYVPLLSWFCNRVLAKLPLLRAFGITTFAVARDPEAGTRPRCQDFSCSVIVPTRNEVGNVEPLLERLPEMGSHTEIIFVDGNSSDGTVEKIEEMMGRYRGEKDIRLIHQIPRAADRTPGRMLKLGKGDAVRKGFEAATGEALIILDSDLSVAPEDTPKFYLALAEGRGELINGTRLVYPMEKKAMRFLNMLGNKTFATLFTWLLDQPIRDTLCGTKALLKRDYGKIAEGRAYFGDFDPYGDFDLLFGAARLHLRILEIPVRYWPRTYGQIKIQRFKHGLMLLRMAGVAARKLKFS